MRSWPRRHHRWASFDEARRCRRPPRRRLCQAGRRHRPDYARRLLHRFAGVAGIDGRGASRAAMGCRAPQIDERRRSDAAAMPDRAQGATTDRGSLMKSTRQGYRARRISFVRGRSRPPLSPGTGRAIRPGCDEGAMRISIARLQLEAASRIPCTIVLGMGGFEGSSLRP